MNSFQKRRNQTKKRINHIVHTKSAGIKDRHRNRQQRLVFQSMVCGILTLVVFGICMIDTTLTSSVRQRLGYAVKRHMTVEEIESYGFFEEGFYEKLTEKIKTVFLDKEEKSSLSAAQTAENEKTTLRPASVGIQPGETQTTQSEIKNK